MSKHIIYIALFLTVLVGCQGKGSTKVSATGSIYECLVVCPSGVYSDIEAVMGADMPCMPQMEPYFTVSHVSNAAFDDFLKPTRNILLIDIDSVRYTTVKAKMSKDYWSKPQRLCRIQSPDKGAFIEYWQEHGEQIRDWFVRQEIERQGSFYRAYTNKEARKALQNRFKCDMLISEDYQLIKDTTDFVWCCNNKGTMRRDLVVYSYPYTDANTFTLDYLCRQRDSVLGRFITAQVAGSYMGTEYKVFPPQLRILGKGQTNDFYAAEVRGLWKIYNGEAMGGPFVSLTRIDETNHRIITAEVFVYAAGQKKRNALRQAEAILYTWNKDR